MPVSALTKALAAKGRLVTLHATAGAALAGEDLPDRIKLFNWGENERIDGTPVIVGDRTLASLAANQDTLGFDRIALDYNHQSVPSHPNFKPDPREHAAFGKVEVVKDDGVYFTALAWTPSGRQNARNYADLSPTPLLDENNEVVFLHSVALCTQGKVKGLHFFSADFLNPEKPTMKLVTMNQDLATLLSALFGCSKDANEEEFLTAGKAYAEKMSKAGDSTKGLEAMSAEFKKLTDRLDAQERDNLIATAIRDGKLVTASVRELPLDDLKKVLGELAPNVVPLSARTPEGTANKAREIETMSVEDKAVAAQLGLTEADYKAA